VRRFESYRGRTKPKALDVAESAVLSERSECRSADSVTPGRDRTGTHPRTSAKVKVVQHPWFSVASLRASLPSRRACATLANTTLAPPALPVGPCTTQPFSLPGLIAVTACASR
jgi:hypothetical protein